MLEKAGVPASIGGGWGIDALVGRQTRPHSDIDLCVPAEQSDAAAGALAAPGFEMTVVGQNRKPILPRIGEVASDRCQRRQLGHNAFAHKRLVLHRPAMD